MKINIYKLENICMPVFCVKEWKNYRRQSLGRFPKYSVTIKIAIFGHDIWNLQKHSRRCILTLFLPRRVKVELFFFCSTNRRFRDTGRFSKFSYLGMKSGIWRNVSKLHIFFYHRGVGGGIKLILSLCGQPFSRYVSIYKISIYIYPLSAPEDRN